LVVVAQDRDAHECARDIVVAEGVPYDFPRGDEVFLAGGSDENAGADHILDRGAGFGECCAHVLDGFGGLPGVVADGAGGAVCVQRARSGEEDQPSVSRCGCGVGVLGGIGEGLRADQGHSLGHRFPS
jgi:hypothetical protein